ncbi:MAG: choice-of-anchor J domain-containing protein [Bacteroidales bacterium]|nr:choice-of-anchor J domain-containing protein [Bacteroidales bacterium]
MKRHLKLIGIYLFALCLGILFNQCEKDQLMKDVNSENHDSGTPEPNVQLPVVSTNTVTNITSTSASCGGNVTSDGGSTVTARGVCWSTSQNPTISNNHTSNGSGTGSFNATLTGLSAYTTYYVRAYATNSKGTSYGSQKSFTTNYTSESILFQESFESGIPSTWTVYDNDGDGYNWSVIPSFNGHNGGYCVSSASWISGVGALTPENWLITPSIYLSGNATLTYWVAVQDAEWAAEHYCVAISTNESTNYTILFQETMTSKGNGKDQGNWYQKSINLSSYSGQTVRIAFIHSESTDQFWLNLDDVKVSSYQ